MTIGIFAALWLFDRLPSKIYIFLAVTAAVVRATVDLDIVDINDIIRWFWRFVLLRDKMSHLNLFTSVLVAKGLLLLNLGGAILS